MFLAQNSTYRCPTWSTKRTFFFCHTTSFDVAAKFTNTPDHCVRGQPLQRRCASDLPLRCLSCSRLALAANLWEVTKEMENNKTTIRHGCIKMLLPSSQRLTAWIKRLPDVISFFKKEVTHLTSNTPADAIIRQSCFSKVFHALLKAFWCKRKKAPLRRKFSLSLSAW